MANARAGLPHAAQVHAVSSDDDADGDRRPRGRRTNGTADVGVLHAGGDRHRDGEHVVDQQRAGHGEPGVAGRG